MSDEKNSVIDHSPTDGAVSVTGAPDVEMVGALDPNCESIEPGILKHTRNVQTQHGDYRSVDELNIFLIPRCLWPEIDDKKLTWLPTTSNDNSNNAEESKEEPEQVVWIEPFADEVCFFFIVT